MLAALEKPRSPEFEQALATKLEEFGLRQTPVSSPNLIEFLEKAMSMELVSFWTLPDRQYTAAIAFKPQSAKDTPWASSFDAGYHLAGPWLRYQRDLHIKTPLVIVKNLEFEIDFAIRCGFTLSRELGNFLTQQANKGYVLNTEGDIWKLQKDGSADLEIIRLKNPPDKTPDVYGVQFLHRLSHGDTEAKGPMILALDDFTRLQMKGADFSASVLARPQPAG